MIYDLDHPDLLEPAHPEKRKQKLQDYIQAIDKTWEEKGYAHNDAPTFTALAPIQDHISMVPLLAEMLEKGASFRSKTS